MVRRYAVPTDLFLELGEKLGIQLQPTLGHDFREVFREARVEAERLAILESIHEEVTLVEIWQKLVTLLPQLEADGGMQSELALEASALMLVPSAAELVQHGRRLHGRVVFISDTYFPRWFIEQQLERFGLFLRGDELFLSSETRRTKRSGALFDFALKRVGLSAGEILHHGDNLYSDVKMARQFGLKAKHLSAARPTRLEAAIGLQLNHLDSPSASRLLGSMRLARLSDKPKESDAAARTLVANFIGPFLWAFADWIFQRASIDGIKRLYFFSRDCHGLHYVAKSLSSRLGLDIECRYLKISRQAVLLPSITELTPSGIPWLRRSWESKELGSILAKLGIEYSETFGVFDPLAGDQREIFRLATEEHWEKFWSALQSPDIQSLLTARIEQRRRDALAFFEQEGLFDRAAFGLVDLGWHQSCQAALIKLLRFKNPDANAQAYYLALASHRGQFLRDCPAHAVFHQAPIDRRTVYSDTEVFRRIPILEHVLNCAPHGSIFRYTQHPRSSDFIVAEENHVSERELRVKSLLYRELEAYVQHSLQPLDLQGIETRAVLSAILIATAKAPLREWAELLRSIEVADDQNNRNSASFVKTRRIADFVRDALRGREYRSLPIDETGIWPELSLAGSSEPIAKLYLRLEQFNRLRKFLINLARPWR